MRSQRILSNLSSKLRSTSNWKIEICLGESSMLSPLLAFSYIFSPPTYHNDQVTRLSHIMVSRMKQVLKEVNSGIHVGKILHSLLQIPTKSKYYTVKNFTLMAENIGGTCHISPRNDAAAFFMSSSLMCSHGSRRII